MSRIVDSWEMAALLEAELDAPPFAAQNLDSFSLANTVISV
jgi:hypothetical protein